MEQRSSRISPLASLAFLLLAIALPLGVAIAAQISVLWAVMTGLLIGALLLALIVFVFHWPRAPHPSLGRLIVMATFGVAFILMIIGSMFARYTAPQDCSIQNSPLSPPQLVCVTKGSAFVEHAVGRAFLSVALILVFASLVAVPSSERELLRRIDLEACSIAIGVSFFFFIAYSSFQTAFALPPFSNGVATWTVLASYLIARLALSIRYR
jgi:hypothetical protein